jgi:putative ABC transport system substrate-binding protein
MMVASAVVGDIPAKVPDLAVKSRLPVMYTFSLYFEAGGLMTYGVNITDLDRRAAAYVDKILKGASQPISLWNRRKSLS